MAKLRRMISVFFVITLLLSSAAVFGQTSTSMIDKSEANSGIVRINYKPKDHVRTRVIVSRGDKKHTYDLKSNNTFPLVFGDGDYSIAVYENVVADQYRLIEQDSIAVELKDKNVVYLQSIQIIDWSEDMSSIKKARGLTQDSENDLDKVTAIYDYITKNISYDYDKANALTANYIPSIDETMAASKGICYDYSALFAAMLRSVGIPTKLIMGRKDDIEIYHAWNQVYLKDTDEWVIIDTTYDALLVQNNLSIPMIKPTELYISDRHY